MKNFNPRTIVTVAVLVTPSACLVSRAAAQQPTEIKAADTSSPRDTLKSFIDACNDIYELVQREQYFDRDDPEHAHLAIRIMDCLDVSQLPAFAREQRAGEAAACLKEILDREELPPWEQIPDLAMIERAGGFEKLSRWRIPGTRITIARIEEGPQRHEYLFTTGTVDRAEEYFKQVRSKHYRSEQDGPKLSKGIYEWYLSAPGDPTIGAIVSRLPNWVQFGRTYGLANWKWPGLLLALSIAISLLVVTYRVYGSLVRRVREVSIVKYCLTIVFPLVATLIPLAFLNVCVDYLTIRGTPLYVISFLASLTAVLASLFLVFATSNRIAGAIVASPHIDPHGLNAQLIRIVSRLVSLTASVVIILAGGQYLGIPLTTLLASAGIGGLAVALGAQDSLKTLFGTISLLADKPFRVGDRIVSDKYDGVVEDIGLRSTRLRLLTGHLVTLPNDQLARSDIENIGRRPFIRRTANIQMPSDTPVDKVKRAVEIVRAALDDHEGMSEEYPPRVFLRDIKDSSVGIFLIYWYHPPDYWGFLAFSEKLNLQIMEQFEAEQIPFASPGLTIHR